MVEGGSAREEREERRMNSSLPWEPIPEIMALIHYREQSPRDHLMVPPLNTIALEIWLPTHELWGTHSNHGDAYLYDSPFNAGIAHLSFLFHPISIT